MSSYPCSLWSPTTKTNKVDLVDAAHINAAQAEIVAMQTNLLRAFDSDGSILSGTSFPSPALYASRQFWKTDENVMYVWTGSTWSPQSGITSVTAGNYLMIANNMAVTVQTTTPTKVLEVYVSRAGTIRVKFVIGKGGGTTVYGQIYRNGSAVGTAQSTTTATGTQYSEDISGWAVGDLCQLYIYNSNGAQNTYGVGLQLFEGTPSNESINQVTYPQSMRYTGDMNPSTALTGLGNIGDEFLFTGGGASTTLYVKTGATTWTAK